MTAIPRVAQLHPDFEWDMAKYWAGRFVEGKNPFSDGRFLLTITDRTKDTEDSHVIAGTIEDCLGRAMFNGLICQNSIEFTKQYSSIYPDPFVSNMTGKARTASTDYIITYKGKQVRDDYHVIYEGVFECKGERTGTGTFVLVSQGSGTPFTTTLAKYRASWEAARKII
jgi:hypothetical protein